MEFAAKWHFGGSIKIMDASYDDIKGSYVEFQASIERHTFQHLGFGIGFFADEVDAREETPRALVLGDWNQTRDGVLLFLRARF